MPLPKFEANSILNITHVFFVQIFYSNRSCMNNNYRTHETILLTGHFSRTAKYMHMDVSVT